MNTNKHEFENPICPQCGRVWARLRSTELMCPSCRRDLDVMNGNAIGPAPGTVERAQVVTGGEADRNVRDTADKNVCATGEGLHG